MQKIYIVVWSPPALREAGGLSIWQSERGASFLT